MDKERTDIQEIDGQQLHVPAVASSKRSRIIHSDSEKPPTNGERFAEFIHEHFGYRY